MRAAAAVGSTFCVGFLIWVGAVHAVKAADADDAPGWTSYPSDSVYNSAWPIAARKNGMEGHARLDCAVSAEGKLSDCKVLEEAPKNAGFAAAALALTPKYVRRVIIRDGHADPERIVVSIGWWNRDDVDHAAEFDATPSPAAKAAVWPTDALKKGQVGFASLRCAVTVQGALRDCWILDETSPRSGFGEAALALTPGYHLKPALKHGAPVESHTSVWVDFFPDEKTDDYDAAPKNISGINISALEALWPANAHGRPGEATLRCVVTVQGLLSNCKVQQESPKGSGFGAAALLLAPSLKYQPAIKSGQSVQAHVSQRIRWQGEAGGGQSFRMVTNLPWSKAPSSRDVLAAYPATAISKAMPGQVVLRCSIDGRGALFDCLIVTERPEHVGFGQASLKLSRQFQFRPGDTDRSLISNLRISLSFQFVPPAAGDQPRYLTKPDWTTAPDQGSAMKTFPAKAADAGLTTGKASLDCLVGEGGRINRCQVVSEEPAGMDFGPSAIQIAQALSVNPWTEEGLPSDGERLRFAIRLNKAAQDAAAQGPTPKPQ